MAYTSPKFAASMKSMRAKAIEKNLISILFQAIIHT
jgi:hypothetical protein